MPKGNPNFDFAAELRKAASQIQAPATVLGPAVGAGPSALDNVFEEEPVPLSVFVQDKRFLGNPPLSLPQYDAVRHIERIYYADMYAQLAEEFESGKQPGRLHIASSSAVWREEKYWSQPLRMINFATLQWGKGCITGDTDIYDARTGRWRPVGEASEALTVQGIPAVNQSGSTEHLPGEPALVSGADRTWAQTDGAPFKRGRGPCVRVTTASGGSIDVFKGHLFVSWENNNLPYKNRYRRAKPIWAQAGGLKVGDRLAIMSKLDCLEPVAQDPREVELVGYWIGDGSMPVEGSNQWAFYVDSKPVADDLRSRYIELVESYEGITAKCETMQSGTMRIRATQPGAGRKLKTPLIDIIRRWGLYGSRAWDKKVPDEFFSLPDDQISLFLSALWDTDGSLYFRNGVPRAQYVTVSEELARGIQRLLLRLGVVSRISSSVKSYVYMGERRQGRRSWSVDVQASKYLKRLLSALRLHGEKEHRRIAGLEHVATRQQQSLDGDIYWDTVMSVEPIGDQDYWDMHVPEMGTYVAGTLGIVSSNSGKDHICRVASMRIAYLLMCLLSPQMYYGMPEQDTIHLLNVASSSGQAQQAFFMPIVRAVKKGWFAEKCIPRQNVISYDKNIESVSGHSDAESQEGLNLLLAIADEIDAFKSKKEMIVRKGASAREPTKSAEGILNMMRTSASTRFPEVFKNVRISYPRYLGSTIQRLTDEAREDFQERGDKSRHYVSGPMATWEVNPRVPGREAFAEDYRTDPVMARAKYECRPARAINPYFRNVQAVDSSFVLTDRLPVTFSYVLDHAAGSSRRVWSPRYSFSDQFFPVRGAVYTMHADLAVQGDRAGLAMAHVMDYTETESTVSDEDGAEHLLREVRPRVKVDFVISYSADASMDPPREIQIRWARQLCFDLIRRGFNIKLFTFDSFQSRDSMQILEDRGIQTDKLSTDLSEEPWRNLRDLMYEGRVEIPRLRVDNATAEQTPFLLRDELLSLTRLPNGRVDHPSDGSKDEADAVACAVMSAVGLGGREEGPERKYFEPDRFTTGGMMDLGFDQRSLKGIWVTGLPSPF